MEVEIKIKVLVKVKVKMKINVKISIRIDFKIKSFVVCVILFGIVLFCFVLFGLCYVVLCSFVLWYFVLLFPQSFAAFVPFTSTIRVCMYTGECMWVLMCDCIIVDISAYTYAWIIMYIDMFLFTPISTPFFSLILIPYSLPLFRTV